MSKTDQAFIDAYRRQTPRPAKAAAKPTPTAPPIQKHSNAHGPHVSFASKPKASLAEVMQSRAEASHRFDAAPATPRPLADNPFAVTQLNRFDWPDSVGKLVEQNAETYAGVIEAVSNQWPVTGLVGCRPGSGATTTTLVLARLLAAQGALVAVIDADPNGNDLAASLGVARHKTLAASLASGAALSEATLHAVDDGVSLLIGGEMTQHPAVLREAIHQLRQTHAVVLIDLGPDPRRLALHADAVMLVHPFDESDAVIEYSCRSLSQASAPLVGTIQTMAPMA